MNIVTIADLQIGESRCGTIDSKTGLHTREMDCLKNIDQSIEYTLEESNKIELFGVLGDIYVDRKPTMVQQREFAKRIVRLSAAGKETIILQGNHDISETDGDNEVIHTSSVIQTFNIPHIAVVDEPQVLHYGDVGVVAMPYVSRKNLNLKTLEETIEYYRETVSMLRSQTGKQKNICLIHQTVENCTMSAGFRDLSTMDEVIVPLDVFKDFDITIGGHIHNHQVMQKKPPVLYVGSIDRVDFGEANQQKGFIHYNTDSKRVKFAKLNAREFLDIRVDVTTDSDELIQDRIVKYIATLDLNEKIVKLVIRIKDSDIVKVNISALNKILSKSFYLQGVSFDTVRTKRTRNEKISESIGIYSALEVFVNSKSEYKKIKKEMLIEGKLIIEEEKNDSIEVKAH